MKSLLRALLRERVRAGLVVMGIGCVFAAPVVAADPKPDGEEAEEAAEPPMPFRDTAAEAQPEGVLNAQVLQKGQWMVAYRYQRTWLKGNRIGTGNYSDFGAIEAQSPRYKEVPRKRSVQVNLLQLGWAPFSRLTLIARLPVVLLQQDNVRDTGRRYETSTEGIGDFRIMAVIPFMKKGNESLLVNLGFRAPTGSITDRVSVSWAPNSHFGYPMQPGRGSWGFMPGLTYRGFWKSLSWGLQYQNVFWLNVNSLGYRPGTRYGATTWAAWSWTDWMSTSFRVGWDKWGNVHGKDRQLGRFPYSSPTRDPMRQGGQRVDLAPGVNFRIPCCGRPQLGFEAVFPVWQQLSGPQLRNRWMLYTGLRAAF